MGVLNITPDSFSDGGRLFRDGRAALDLVLREARSMVDSGAAIVDVGGESTRPGASPVSEAQEIDRVIPVVEALSHECDAVISVDSSSPRVMAEAAAAGAGMLNDVRALSRPGAIAVAASTGLPVCLMHMQGTPQDMQSAPRYTQIVDEISTFLLERVRACEDGGIDRNAIVLDPGFGFGKTLSHNLDLLAHLGAIRNLGFPVMVGLSRKSLIAKITGRNVEDRLAGSLALALLAAQRGASILRVHDVPETADVLKILRALKEDTQ